MTPIRVTARFLPLAFVLAACAPVPIMPPGPGTVPMPAPQSSPQSSPRERTAAAAARNFTSVISRMEPVIERECRIRRTTNINCDYQFVVDDRPGQEPNAFQTLDKQGRPVIGFNLPLIAETRNGDEIAFVVGHEASHHILNHLNQRDNVTRAGSVILVGIAVAAGAGGVGIDVARNIGASVGSRVYSKDRELEADYLGAVITLNAGYDPVKGAEFFRRIPDPGDHVLGTHPSRAARMQQVARAVDDVRSGRTK